MLLDLLYELRRRKVPVGTQEWLALLRALEKGLHESSLTAFYHLGRSLLVHTEAHFDAYDQAFAVVFKGIEGDALELTDELAAWLDDPAMLAYLSPEDRAALEALSLDQLREMLEERLNEQQERHEGGNRWIGTGGTSPFGSSGYHPSGVRIGGGGGRSAAQIAAARRFRAYRQDLTLDVRQLKVALRKLRDLRREGSRLELDLDETVDETCKNAGELELVWRPPRRNNVKVILLMDVGGSMTPHARSMSQLFSAAMQSKHFRDFHAYYFHNCVYDRVWEDAWFEEAVTVPELLARYGEQYKLILVGDAMMHPMELFEQGGAIDWWQDNITPGIAWMRRLADHYERCVWLNPELPRYWRHITVRAIRDLFPMFPLTLEGLEASVSALVRGRGEAEAASRRFG
ncbi:MAG: VWA containing CoxE family protein [Proteobacteria bacterium]|nr:MAG: VWA containing CoxE family protein [Pseudomonadota bacterium]